MKVPIFSCRLEDFNQRYTGTWGWLEESAENKRMLVKITRVDRNGVEFNTQNATGVCEVTGGSVFEFLPVTKGLFQTSDGAIWYMNRVPARQYHRGISEKNTRVLLWGSEVDNWRNAKLSHKLLEAVFSPNYSPLKKWHKDTFLLNEHFAILGTGFSFWNVNVGTYNPADGTIILSNKIILQEVQDCIKRNDYPFKVI